MNSPNRSRLGLLLAGCLLLPMFSAATRANSEMREWKLTTGDKLRAQIEDVDEAAQTVSLQGENEVNTVLALDRLTTMDRAWILEWVEMGEELVSKATKLGGRIEHYDGKGKTLTTGFHVYFPSGEIPAGTQRPLMILFDCSGKSMRYLMRHMEAAEIAKLTIVTCDLFSNKMENDEAKLRFREVFPLIEATVPHDPSRIFMGGTSGGALRAFTETVNYPTIPWAGIYSNGGWLGGTNNWDKPYPAMRVAMVNGDKDLAVNQVMDDEAEVLRQHGSTVAVIAFEGGHQVPPATVQVKAFKWLLKEIP